MAKPILTLDRFKNAHIELRDKLLDYSLTKRGRSNLAPITVENLRDRAALSLKATNARARIAFVEALDTGLSDFLKSPAAPRSTFWVTIVADALSYPFVDAKSFSPAATRRTLTWLLREVSYIGMIDVAFYGNFGKVAVSSGTGKRRAYPTLSFHIHALVWGCSENYMRGMKVAHDCFVPSMFKARPSFHYLKIASTKVRGKAIYMSKMPLRETRLMRGMIEQDFVDLDTGAIERKAAVSFKAKKGELRMGDASKVQNALSSLSLFDLSLAGGHGRTVMRNALDNAIEKVRTREAASHKKLDQLDLR